MGGRPPAPQPGWEPPPRTQKGLVGALLDANFDHLVTPKLIKVWYVLALVLITVQCLVVFGFGVWIATWDDFWAWGVILVLTSPVVWLFELIMVRILMEAVIVRFKGVEYLRVIKDKI
ncbi:DUF4282 domain-containing protein [Actinomadura flavalba]|uniref:DUF4282 domain-containing protein n=1 Tax=Actinomadura flavalba TaxID=1120938 RepID=UPI00036DC57E|nr:DUF4282 domain-containing protein [Actinomadura flavalba]